MPLLLRSNFIFQTTPLSSEFVPITLHIGQWFCVIKSVFSSTVSPVQKSLDILDSLLTFLQGLDNSFLHLQQNSLLKCWILLHLLLQYKSGFWKTPGGGITTFIFIANILFGDIRFALCLSLIVSTVSGWEFIIASVSVINVCRDSSSKLCSYVYSRELKLALIWQSQIPPMWLAAGWFLLQVIQSHPWSWKKFSWSISWSAFNSSCPAATKLEHSLCKQLIFSVLEWMSQCQDCVTSIWTVTLARQMNIVP